MKIDYIDLKNYRQYKGPIRIDFTSSDKQKSFVIIEGANGTGKSNILNAITWCFYGKEIHLKESARGLPIINTIAWNKLKKRDYLVVEVKIQMKDESKGDVYQILRRIRCGKNHEGKIEKIPYEPSQERDKSEFKIYQLKRGNWEEEDYPASWISRFIPENIMEYFFFDGERLNEYFREASGEEIKKAIFKISKLDLLEGVIKHLESMKGELLRKERGLPPQIETIQQDIGRKEELIKELRLKIRDTLTLIRRNEIKKKEINKKLREYSPKLVQELASKRQKSEEELETLEIKIEEKCQEKNRYIVEVAPIMYLALSLIDTKKMIKKGEREGKIPPPYDRTFIQRLLKNNRCVCGTDLSKCRECKKELEKALKECTYISDITKELIEIGIKAGTSLEKVKYFREQHIKYGKDIKSLEDKKKKKIEEIADINQRLQGVDDKDVQEAQIFYRSLEEALREEHIKLGDLQRQLKEVEEEKRGLETKRKKELEKKDKYKKINKKISFCDKSTEVAKKIKDQVMQEIREEIEEKTQRQFSELHWKKEELEISIDSEYNISVKDQFGMEQVDTLSAGERQLLALSFMAALISVSGFEPPIVIDTPLGRFSREPKENVAKNLPNYLKERQVTLLVTDEDYNTKVRKKLLPRISKEYRIHFIETSNGNYAEIKPYEQNQRII